MKRTAFKTVSITTSFVSGLFLMAGVTILLEPQLPQPQALVVEEEVVVPEIAESTVKAAIVPHHLVAQSMIEETFTKLAAEEPATIVLVSPDHWGRAKQAFSTVEDPSYLNVPVNKSLVSSFVGGDLAEDFAFDAELFADEHGINGLVPLLHAAMPDAQIVPIAISALTTQEEVYLAVTQLDLVADDRTVVVSSTDFSHYLSKNAADFHDSTSIAAISNFEFQNFPELELDCWQCISFASLYAQKRDAHQVDLIDHSNLAVIAQEPDMLETTSYATFLFREGENHPPHTFTMLFTGDIMLGRHVERLMNAHGDDYPFENISQFLRGIDLVHGNLEGPIVTQHAQTPDFSTSFSFAPRQAGNVAYQGFDVVALGNNHSLDRGARGYDDTKFYLDQVGVAYAGHYNQIGDEFVYDTKLRGYPVEFLSFNETYPGFDEEAAVALVQSRSEVSEALTVVNIHWGIEYQLHSYSTQQELAHALIDAGADVIIGHHPHVTQEVEEYNGKLIFYSLGNFVFDQYFSTDVQEGLLVGMTVTEDQIEYRLFPIKSSQSQPRLMTPGEALPWLEGLAQRSDEELSEQIKNGILITDNPITYEF